MISCSNTVPQIILPRQTIANDIYFYEGTTIYDLNVNLTILNPHDTDLIIQFLKPGMTMLTLSSQHGGSGSDYINTTFNDEAADSIKNGIPPFTGSFKPDIALSYFDNKPLNGLWQLRVTNLSLTDTAYLESWCIQAEYFNPIGIKKIAENPYTFKLHQNYPNPFNAKTKIRFALPYIGDAYIHPAQIKIFNILGQEIQTLVNESLKPGTYEVEWDGTNYPSGIYFYRLTFHNYTETKKLILLK
jgi:subtilisin-like proprotein convertase family protein